MIDWRLEMLHSVRSSWNWIHVYIKQAFGRYVSTYVCLNWFSFMITKHHILVSVASVQEESESDEQSVSDLSSLQGGLWETICVILTQQNASKMNQCIGHNNCTQYQMKQDLPVPSRSYSPQTQTGCFQWCQYLSVRHFWKRKVIPGFSLVSESPCKSFWKYN